MIFVRVGFMISRELTVLGIRGTDHADPTIKAAAAAGMTSTGHRSHRDGPEMIQMKSLADEITGLFGTEGEATHGDL